MIEFIYFRFKESMTTYDKYAIALTSTIIILPIFVTAMYNLCVSYRKGVSIFDIAFQ